MTNTLKLSVKNQTIYKVSISVLFGLAGFYTNFHTLFFPFGEYTAAILLGLLFPMLITLSWGWKYGLLSALIGGCQTMWWLWGASNGYAIFFVVPPFTLWVVWHGIFAELRRKQKAHKWWLNIYIVEIIFRILSSVNLLTLCRWAVTLNPPDRSWASDAPNIIPVHFSVFVTIKQAAIGFTILLLADVLLNIKYVRSFFKLKEYTDNKKTGYIISFFLLLGCLFWLLDSVFYSFAFHKESSFIDLFALNIPDYNVFTRTVFFIFCLICGLITSGILRTQREGEIALGESEEKLINIFEHSTNVFYSHTPEHILTYMSPQVKEILGYELDEVLIKWTEFASDNPINKIGFELTEKAIKTGKPQPAYELEFIHKNGKKVWIEVHEGPVVVNGKTISIVGAFTDRTEHKKAEKELKKYRDHLENLVKERTAELEQKNKKLEEFNELFVGRELRIKELKDKVKELEGK